jgi:hypothetical protein
MAGNEVKWYVMRDLKRRNAKELAYQELQKAGLEVFTPMTQMIMTIGGRKRRKDVPVIQDLLFVHACKAELDPYVEKYPNLQYRYQRGRSIDHPMVVDDKEIERFIKAVTSTESTVYYKPGELTESMKGRRIQIVGGLLDGMEGRLLSIKGMRKRRLIVEVPDFITAAIEVNPDFITFV